MTTLVVRNPCCLSQDQNRTLNAIAALRGRAEAEVIRNAQDRLPDLEGGLRPRLDAAGVPVTVRHLGEFSSLSAERVRQR